MAKTDKDLILKLRLRRLMFWQGYWCPLEVELTSYDIVGAAVNRQSLTDLDVLAVKFSPLFEINQIVGDCKSGKNVADISRLFWLRGLVTYFQAHQGYYLRPTINSHARAMAPKLGLRVIDGNALDQLEEIHAVNELVVPFHDVGIHCDIIDLWGIDVAKGESPTEDQLLFKEVYTYLNYYYWYYEESRNPFLLVAKFNSIADRVDPNNPSHRMLAYAGAERFAVSLLTALRYVQAQDVGDLKSLLRLYLYGGPLALKEKRQFFDMLNAVAGSSEELDPPWIETFFELVARLEKYPSGAIDVPRYLQAIFIWVEHLGKKELPALSPSGVNTPALVAAKDVARTFARISGFDESVFRALDNL